MKKYEIVFNSKKNNVATAIYILGILTYVAGFIVGVAASVIEVEGYSGYYDEFSWSIAFFWWISAAISGTLIIGFSEIIKLLNDIKYKTYVENDNNVSVNEQSDLPEL